MPTGVKIGLVLLSALAACATTLEQLSLDEMIRKSTGIVRAKVVSTQGGARGGDIYTSYRIVVSETLKGPAVTEVSSPGGVFRGVRQAVAGAPRLNPGEEYLLFLWTGKSGVTQVIGMSQGVFQIKLDTDGTIVVSRTASAAPMVDRSGRPVNDSGLSMRLSEMKARVAAAKLEEAER